MKSLFIKSVMMLVVIVGLVHYALYLKTGQFPWGDGWRGPSLPTPSSMPNVTGLVPPAKIRVYKWVDDRGVINYSQELPPAEYKGQILDVDSSANIVLGMPLSETTSSADSQRSKPALLDESSEQIKTPIEKAVEAKELLEARDLEQKKILDDL